MLALGGVVFALVVVGLCGAFRKSHDDAELAAEEAAAAQKAQQMAGPVVNRDDCCTQDTAQCHACSLGENIEEFCYNRQHAAQLPLGCEQVFQRTKCCEEDDANCRACKVGESIETYCAKEEHNSQKGCSCAHIEQNTEYIGGDLFAVFWVPTPEACCQRCREEPKCTAWSHYGFGNHKCALKAPVQVKRNPNMPPGHTSGLPSKADDVEAIFQIKPISGICMQVVKGEEWNEKHPLELAHCDNMGRTREQHFHFKREKGIIQSVHDPNYCITAGNISNSKATLEKCNEADTTQQWGYFINNTIRSKDSGLCLLAPHRNDGGSHIFAGECKVTDPNQQWDMWYITPVDVAALDPVPQMPQRNHSLYCVASMLPWGGELALLKMQYAKKASLFGCEGFDVYSNVIVNLGGVQTRMVYTDLHCNWGKTVLNTKVFVHFWNQVIKDGRFMDFTWTVKMDPDAVFLPNRLHDVVRGKDHAMANDGDGMILNNCVYGMHGPVEVVSRRALQTYGDRTEECNPVLRWAPQEDVFLWNCMKKLGVVPKNQFDLLAEDHCHSPQWWTCKEGFVAFHPFKQVKAWEGCLDRASKAPWR